MNSHTSCVARFALLAGLALQSNPADATPGTLLRNTIARPQETNAAFADHAIVSYTTDVALRTLAENGLTLSASEAPLVINLPGQPQQRLSRRYFNPIRGFIIDERGDLLIDPSASDTDLAYFWYGGDQNAELALYVEDGRVAGTLRSGTTVWMLSSEGKQNLLRQLDASSYGDDAVMAPDTNPAPATYAPLHDKRSERSMPTRAKVVDVIDVLVVYTQPALQAATEYDGMNAAVNFFFEQTNAAFKNSGMSTVQIANVLPSSEPAILVPYTEGPGVPAADRWQDHLQWIWENGGTLRDLHEADVVMMLVRDNELYCGLAFMQTTPAMEEDFSELAFGVAGFSCSFGPVFAFAHEFGHILGMNHDIVAAYNYTLEIMPYPWSLGYVFSSTNAKAKDLMAYNSSCGWLCTSNLQYSNPEIGFISHPTIPSGSSLPIAGNYSAFAAKTGSHLALAVSEYRGRRLPSRIFRSDFEHLQK